MSSSLTQYLQARHARVAFVLVQVEYSRNGAIHCVNIPPEPNLVTTKAGRKAVEQDPKYHRWSAGGGLTILDCLDRSIGLTRLRDRGAPSFGDHWTLGSGLSSSVDDLIHPERLAVREEVEEFIVATPNGLLVPTFGNEYDEISFSAVASGRKLVAAQADLPDMFRSGRYLEAQASTVSMPNMETVEIRLDGELMHTTSPAIIAIDEGTRGIDYLNMVRVKVPFALSEISVFDGESGGNGEPLNALVAGIPFDGTVPMYNKWMTDFYRDGYHLDGDGWGQGGDVKMTPPLVAILRACGAKV